MISKNIDATKKHISIVIDNTQTLSGAIERYTETSTGIIICKNGKKHVYYTLGTEKHALTVDKNRVKLVKNPSGSVLTFEQNTEYITPYVTPYGAIDMTVFTESVSDLLDSDGTLSITYRLSVGGTETIHNNMLIKIKEI